MKKLILHSLLFISLMTSSFAQSKMQNIREGNDAFKSNQYVKAEQEYRKALGDEKAAFESAFNLGDALYRQGKYEEAGKYFQAAVNQTEDKNLKAKAFHNLGNTLLKAQKLQESLEAYKRSLINNPKDDETRYNYAYTKQMIQEQEQQQEEQNQDQDNQDQQEEQQNEDQQNQDQQNQEEQNQEQQEEQQEEQNQEQQNQDEAQQKEQQQKEQQVSREDAERILEALNQDEKQLQEKLKKKKGKKVKIDIEKDW